MNRRGRIAVTLAALVFAVLATASGIDRSAAEAPRLAALLPEAMRAETWRVQSEAALARGDSRAASEAAGNSLDADPVDPRGASLLATAVLADGDREGGAKAFAAADRLGLRTPLVQAYFFETALASGDAKEAARRLDTLLLVNPSMAGIDYFFTALEASDSGRRQLGQRLTSDPLWSRAYLTGFQSDDAVLVSRARFLGDKASGIQLGCGRIEPMLRELAVRNLRSEAQRLAQVQCPSRAAAQALADPGFEAVGEDDAFGWRRHASGDVRITEVGERDKMVEMENRAGSTRLVLSQPVALERGEYRIFASIAAERPDALVVSVDCGEPARPTRGSGSLGRGQLVQASGCSDEVLGIWLRPRSGQVRIDNLRISSVGDHAGDLPSSSAK
ncbi:hypothetical protein [Qipengyuania sphaerica]|uniref:hypothetical protein n=1 Tax=Qipengyuania sphaerica TaxID=2867243 RepID=UPI001C8846A6|nr:hypothetical protein [Qipengyuania sphaerica]MBX7540056.1 hypothetical protein [Qipengyuania sphaerica]